MRRTSAICLALAAFVAMAATAQHVRTRQHRADVERERLRLLADTQQAQAKLAETRRQLEAEQKRSAAIGARTTTPAAAQRPGAAHSAAKTHAPTLPATLDPEMRRLRVATFVSEQRMQFAALLHRLGFTSSQRQAFDRIQADFYSATIDGTTDASRRQQSRDARAAALRELFGDKHDAWVEANQQQSARAIVDQIVQQTFPSSGALNAAQADELTRIVAQHRVARPATARPDSADYDWDRIMVEAQTVLADRQMEDFAAAVRYRRASDQMSTIAAKAKTGLPGPEK